jgi:opacity protein-like surface antigen
LKNRLRLLVAVIACLAARPAGAQTLADYDYANLSFRGIGLDYGYIWPSRVLSTPAYSLRIDLGFLGPGVRVVPSLTYWSSEFRKDEISNLADQISQLRVLKDRGVTVTANDLGQIKWSDLSASVDAHLLWTTPVGVLTYAGVGAGVHALNGRGTFIEKTFVEDLLDSMAAGVAVMGGLELRPTPRLRLYGEARYTFVSDVRYPGVRIGGALMLPTHRTETHAERR